LAVFHTEAQRHEGTEMKKGKLKVFKRKPDRNTDEKRGTYKVLPNLCVFVPLCEEIWE